MSLGLSYLQLYGLPGWMSVTKLGKFSAVISSNKLPALSHSLPDLCIANAVSLDFFNKPLYLSLHFLSHWLGESHCPVFTFTGPFSASSSLLLDPCSAFFSSVTVFFSTFLYFLLKFSHVHSFFPSSSSVNYFITIIWDSLPKQSSPFCDFFFSWGFVLVFGWNSFVSWCVTLCWFLCTRLNSHLFLSWRVIGDEPYCSFLPSFLSLWIHAMSHTHSGVWACSGRRDPWLQHSLRREVDSGVIVSHRWEA